MLTTSPYPFNHRWPKANTSYCSFLVFWVASALVHTLQDFAGLLKQRICDVKGVPSHRQRLLEIACKFGSNFADGILWGFSGVFRICKKTQVYFVSDKKGKIHSFRPVMVGYLTYFGTRLSCNPQFGQAKRRKKQKLVLLFGSCRKRSFPFGSL